MRNNTIIAAITGAIIGVILAVIQGWDIVEPITGSATLAITIYLGWQNIRLQKRLGDAAMKKRSFSITLGLVRGYDTQHPSFNEEEVVHIIKEWTKKRILRHEPIIAGMVSAMTLIYPVRNQKNNQEASRVIEEPGVIFSGSLSPNYDNNRSDKEVIETLNGLAQHLGREMGQKRVYLSYCEKQWTIDIQ